LHPKFMYETMDNYTGQRELFGCDSGPRLGIENVILLNVLSSFLKKKSYNKLLEKKICMKNNTKIRQAIFPTLFIYEIVGTCDGKRKFSS